MNLCAPYAVLQDVPFNKSDFNSRIINYDTVSVIRVYRSDFRKRGEWSPPLGGGLIGQQGGGMAHDADATNICNILECTNHMEEQYMVLKACNRKLCQ